MKTLFATIFLTALVALATCCTTAERHLSADVSSITVEAADVTDHVISVSSSSSWMVDASGLADWLSVWYDTNNPSLLFVAATEKNESLEERSDDITIISGDGLVLTIPLTQLSMDVRFNPTPPALETFAARNAPAQTIDVDTDLTWEAAQLHGEWIVLTRGTAEEGTENTLTVEVPSTRSLQPRRDTIVLRPTLEAFASMADSVAVEQTGLGLVAESPMMNEQTLEIEIPREGGEVIVSVFSHERWDLSTDASEQTATLSLTEGPADTENGITVVVTVAPNDTTEPRTFVLTFESGGETYEYTCNQQSESDQPTEPTEET